MYKEQKIQTEKLTRELEKAEELKRKEVGIDKFVHHTGHTGPDTRCNIACNG